MEGCTYRLNIFLAFLNTDFRTVMAYQPEGDAVLEDAAPVEDAVPVGAAVEGAVVADAVP
jgi:hypothetical protein